MSSCRDVLLLTEGKEWDVEEVVRRSPVRRRDQESEKIFHPNMNEMVGVSLRMFLVYSVVFLSSKVYMSFRHT